MSWILSDKACRIHCLYKDLPKCTATLSSDDEGFWIWSLATFLTVKKVNLFNRSRRHIVFWICIKIYNGCIEPDDMLHHVTINRPIRSRLDRCGGYSCWLCSIALNHNKHTVVMSWWVWSRPFPPKNLVLNMLSTVDDSCYLTCTGSLNGWMPIVGCTKMWFDRSFGICTRACTYIVC